MEKKGTFPEYGNPRSSLINTKTLNKQQYQRKAMLTVNLSLKWKTKAKKKKMMHIYKYIHIHIDIYIHKLHTYIYIYIDCGYFRAVSEPKLSPDVDIYIILFAELHKSLTKFSKNVFFTFQT